MDTLSLIDCVIAEACQSSLLRDKVVTSIIDTEFISRLQELHEVCEDLDAIDALHVIYNIAKHMVLLNSSLLFEHIIRDDTILGFAAMLEYDQDHPVEHGTFRNFLRDSTRFKQVVPIKDPEMQEKIHQTFRLQYLKDAVLSRIMDDGTLPVINALIFCNHAQIVSHIQGNHELLSELFSVLEDPATDKTKRRDVVFFVHQLGNLARNLPGGYRIGLYRTLSQHGIFLALEYALQAKNDSELRSAGVDILLAILEHDRALVRLYILEQSHSQQKPASDLFQMLISGTKRSLGTSFQVLCCDIVRALLEIIPPANGILSQQMEIITATSESGKDTDDFLDLFYSRYAHGMMVPLLDLSSETIALVDANKKDSSLLFFLCETLSMMVKRHGYRARGFVFSSNISKSVCLLLTAKHGHIKLTALRFIRSCVGLRDEAFNKYVIANRLVDPIVALYVDVYSRGNLIASACREFFNFIAACPVPSLLAHIVGTFAKPLRRVPETLDHLREAYNHYLEDMERAKNGAGGDGLATPTVDTGRRSAVSVNMLIGRENSVSGLLNVQNGVNDKSGGPWGCSIADEMEDAYLESSNEEEVANAAHTALLPLTIVTNQSPIADIDDTIQSPELDGLQDCLEIYSDAENSVVIQSSQSVDNIADSEVSTVGSEPGAPSNIAMYHTTSASNRNYSEFGNSGSPNIHSLPTLSLAPMPQTPANDHKDESGLNNINRYAKLTDAFPDRQPIGRKSLAKRPFAGRVDKRPHIKVKMLPAKKTPPEILDVRTSPNTNGTVPKPLPFLKRQRSCNGSKESGTVNSHRTYTTIHSGNCCDSNSWIVSNGDSRVVDKVDIYTTSSDVKIEDKMTPNVGVVFAPASSSETQ
ncbi:Platinum sensitivity protein, partial [Coemansia sp. RSA 1933]